MEWWISASIALWWIFGTMANIWVVRKCFPTLDTDVSDIFLCFILGFAWPLVIIVFLCLASNFANRVIIKKKGSDA